MVIKGEFISYMFMQKYMSDVRFIVFVQAQLILQASA